MQKYTDIIQDINGNAISGATVTIKDSPSGATSTTYAANAIGTNTNPLTTDGDGRYTFYAKDGNYYASVSKSGITAEDGPVFTLKDQSGWVSVKGYGAVGDGVTDDTAAIQAASDTGKSVFFPDGTYKTTANITHDTIGQVFFGTSMELSGITPTGAGVKGFVWNGGTLARYFIRDLFIVGGSTTGHAIDGSNGGFITTVYDCAFENIKIYMGGKAIYHPIGFSCSYKNIQFSSYTDNGIEINGSNATTLIQCYAHRIDTTGKVGYRIYGAATMIGCNGLDFGEVWGKFGSYIPDGDPVSEHYQLNLIGCNIEDFTVRGIQLKNDGGAIFNMCTFYPPAAGTYECSLQIDYCSGTSRHIVWQDSLTSSKGATKTKLGDIYTSNSGTAPPICIGNLPTYDSNGVLTTLGSIKVGSLAFATNGISINQATIGRLYGFYSPAVSTWTANTATFAVTSLDRVKTANTVGTNLDNATGGVAGQILTIHVLDANTTIRHNIGGAGRFMNSTAANIAATNGRPYQYVSDGTIWWQI